MLKLLNLALLLLTLSACATQRFDLGKNEKKTVYAYEGKHHFIFWGVGQKQDVDPVKACRAGDSVEAVDTHITFVDTLLAGITLGVYYPLSYSVYCSPSEVE